MSTSVLTKKQVKTYGPVVYTENGETYRITAKVRYDDECGNGHNSFAITADIKRKGNYGGWIEDSGGCCHDAVAKHFPELAPYIKWHLTSSDGPMYYIANTLYHVLEHGPTHAWVYYTGGVDPLGIGGNGKRLLSYIKAEDARKAEGQPGYEIKWNEETSKTRNLDYARSSAVWPDATDEQLLDPNLEQVLNARHADLMQEFKTAVESLGFVY